MTEVYLNSKYLLNPDAVPQWVQYSDDGLYRRLYLAFKEYSPFMPSDRYFPAFRKWMIDNHKCYSDGTSKLYFKTEEDLIMCRLKV